MARHLSTSPLLNGSLFTSAWWRETALRVAATVLAALLPLLAQLGTGDVRADYALSVAALAGIASFVTAVATLPDPESLPLWKAILYRAARTLGQTVAAGIGGYILVQDVPWTVLAGTAAAAAAVTVIRTLLSVLPEVTPSVDGDELV